VDEYWVWYQLAEVRSFVLLKKPGILTAERGQPKKRYLRLPVAGLDKPNHCTYLLTESPWRTEDFRQQRLQLILHL